MTIADARQREAALEPERSFIVQAPAGSGKTELLIQRYLGLLAKVAEPEEILCVTFTRKAAAEMRRRILAALARGKQPDAPTEAHTLKTWTLARAVLSQNEMRGWSLSETPSRLKIQTIDALCASITRQMPCLSRFGVQPCITENPAPLYALAARRTIADLESGAAWSPAVEALVRHLDNHLSGIAALVAEMLARRDQWLRHVPTDGPALSEENFRQLRGMLEDGIAALVTDALIDLRRRFSQTDTKAIFTAARYAARNLKNAGEASAITILEDLVDLPEASPEALDAWVGLAALMLTNDNAWRKSLTVKQGFPASSQASDPESKHRCKAFKDGFAACLKALEDRNDLAKALGRVRILPRPRYTDGQWHILQALFEILKVAAAHLQQVFQAEGQTDFTEIARRAASALGEPESPTDLLLALDYRISHILMDEFQDTSASQFDLLLRLTAGWTPGDGRTMFAVGDPMQSIYGFREAEVGLFLEVWENGLGTVEMVPLQLSVNFRSQKGVIDWVNRYFPDIMPPHDDKVRGGVHYAPSTAFHDALAGRAVTVHAFAPPDKDAEAAAVADCVKTARQEDPDGTIAILVRGRAHLTAIVPALKAEGLSFQAVEIDPLASRPVILDLMALTRAILHPADRIAWLALLRAPWCGLSLHGLHGLTDQSDGRTLLELMATPDRVSRLSADDQARLARIRDLLVPAIRHQGRKSLRRTVEGLWLGLGGPACASGLTELADADAFLDLLDRLEASQTPPDILVLSQAAAALYARPDSRADSRLQIMTIHKAKGLEFDTVILPALEKTPPNEKPQLLRVLERTAGEGRDLLVAPISATGEDKDPIYRYIESIQAEKHRFEDARLLYVAVTRAKKRLHLMGSAEITPETGEIRPPVNKSLLASLWPAVKDDFLGTAGARPVGDLPPMDAETCREPATASLVSPPPLRRLSPEWRMPEPEPEAPWPLRASAPSLTLPPSAPEFDWAGEAARLAGVVAHRWLRIICEQGLSNWNEARVTAMVPAFRIELSRLGAPARTLSSAGLLVQEALINAVTDDQGRWILSPHPDGACEYALTGMTDAGIVSVSMDRTFVDETGVRWIIDYKTGTHQGGSMNAFLDREQERYKPQLETYAALMRMKEERKIRMGLYFPMIQGWREWAAG